MRPEKITLHRDAMKQSDHKKTNRRVAVISANWHSPIVGNAVTAISAEFKRQKFPPKALEFFEVPGVFEIPLHAKRLAQSQRFDAVIACGFIVNGGIYRHEFVSTAVIDALMQVQLEQDLPIFSAVLTPQLFHENEEHQRFFAEHFTKKGREVARACLTTLAALEKLPRAAKGLPA